MKCSNCGHENDTDAEFCEKCGSNLKKSSMPDTTMILIVLVIVLVAIVGVAAGYIFYGNVNHIPITNNTTNTTVNSTNQSNNKTQTNPTTQASTGNSSGNSGNNDGSKVYTISESQALQIVQENAGNQNYVYAGTQPGVNGDTNYVFQVRLNDNIYGQEQFSTYEVDAETGEMY